MQRSPEFQDLRKTFRGFTFPVSVAFFLWFLVFVVVATLMPEAMATPFLGLNVGLWLGLAQFFTTFLITWASVRYADRHIEPRSSALRESLEHPQAA